MLGFMLRFFFFKQKTAYEMRISDWSSDVCSSDLDGRIRLCRDGNVERGNRNDARCDPRSYGQHVENRDRSADRRELTSRDQRRAVRRSAEQIGRASCRERVCQYV